jgi:multiple sugar transport system substrate-binding protein
MMKVRSNQLSRRQFMRSAVGVAAGGLLVACVPATQPAGEEAQGSQAPLELTLLMVDWNEDSRRLYEEEILPAFAELNAGLSVAPDWTGWGELDAKFMTASASGLSPDIFQADNVEFGPKYNSRDIVAELDDLVAATEGAEAKLADYYIKAIDEGSRIDGKLMAIPYILDNRAVFYRKDFFDEVGIDETAAFTGWDAFRQAAIALTVRDGDAFTRAGWWSNVGMFCFHTYVQFLWQNGGSILNETNDAVAFDSDAGIEALAFWTQLIRQDQVGPVEDMPSVGDLSPFTAGQLSMIFSGYGMLLNVQSFAPDVMEHVGITLLNQEVKGSLWYANTFFLSKKEHVNEAWSLLNHLVFNDDNFRKYHEAQGGLPPRKSITETASHITPLHLILIDDVMNAPGSHTTPPVPFGLEVLDRLTEMCQKAILGEATPQEAIATAADEANQIIDRHLSGA